MTNVEVALNQKASELPPGTFRHTVLVAAKRFKSSWVELGKLLVKVRNEALFEQWGFATFDAYCLSELRIRKGTADKLTRSFSFLDKHEPQAVAHPEVTQTAPPWEVVQVLAAAEERGQLSAQDYKSIRDSIWDSEKPVSELRRDLVERFPAPEPEAPSDEAMIKRFAGSARRLAEELGRSRKIPKALAERAEALAEELDQLAAAKA